MTATELINSLINLYDQNKNEPQRKKVLDGILKHPCGNILARCIFERLDSSFFLAARNLLIPKNDGDEYGPYDSILEPEYCKSILRSLGSTDYVINLLRDEFKRKYERDVDSLSDIARIVTEREDIKNETAEPKVILEMDEDYPNVKIGSEWIISETMINDINDEPQTDEQELYVYKISRSSGILLKQIHLPLSFFGFGLLMEPFLIRFDGNDVWEVHNLLEPKQAPMTIQRSPKIFRNIRFDLWTGSEYESDILPNGKLPESILFPVIYKPNETSFCVDCVNIQRSEIKTQWTQTFQINHRFNARVIFVDRDNSIVRVSSRELDEFGVFHVILSKGKVTKYTLPKSFGYSMSFGIYEEKIYLYERTNNTFGYLTLSEEGVNFKRLCILAKQAHTHIYIGKDEIQYCNIEDEKIKRIETRRLLDFINDENEEKLIWQREIDGKLVTLPIVDLCQFEFELEFELSIDRSKIGRASKLNKIELFI